MKQPALNSSNLVLIGMPGAGKSTQGALIARQAGVSFLDTDQLIQQAVGANTLQDIVDGRGYLEFLKLEADVICRLDVSNYVIATGGSVVCSRSAMHHLKTDGFVLYLKTRLETLADRVTQADARGIAMKPGQTFAALYEERSRLYESHADSVLLCDGLPREDICREAIQAWKRHGWTVNPR